MGWRENDRLIKEARYRAMILADSRKEYQIIYKDGKPKIVRKKKEKYGDSK